MNTKRVLIVLLIVFVIGISTVQAEGPVVKACLGKSVSQFNKDHDEKLGQGVSIFAQNPEILYLIKIEVFDTDRKPVDINLPTINNLGQLVKAIKIGTFSGKYVQISMEDPAFFLEIENSCFEQ